MRKITLLATVLSLSSSAAFACAMQDAMRARQAGDPQMTAQTTPHNPNAPNPHLLVPAEQAVPVNQQQTAQATPP